MFCLLCNLPFGDNELSVIGFKIESCAPANMDQTNTEAGNEPKVNNDSFLFPKIHPLNALNSISSFRIRMKCTENTRIFFFSINAIVLSASTRYLVASRDFELVDHCPRSI